MIVVLIGYMASGKSTIGRILAKKIGYDFIDLDDFIEEKENMAVSAIFKTKGEIYFRKIESQYLKDIISSGNKIILSLGGGTPCYHNNMEIIVSNESVKSIYLKASIKTLIGRLKNEKNKRPLVAHIETEEALAEFIGKHLFERGQFYNLANKVIATDDKTENVIIEELLFALF